MESKFAKNLREIPGGIQMLLLILEYVGTATLTNYVVSPKWRAGLPWPKRFALNAVLGAIELGVIANVHNVYLQSISTVRDITVAGAKLITELQQLKNEENGKTEETNE